jgi:hypothetical protein
MPGLSRLMLASELAGQPNSLQRHWNPSCTIFWQLVESDMTQTARYCLLALVLMGAPGRSQDGVRVIQKPDAQKSDEFLFDVQPRMIAPGEVATLRWSIKDATKVVIEEASDSGRELHKIGTFGGSESLQIRPKEDTTYIVSCEGSTNYSCASVTVRVRVKQR